MGQRFDKGECVSFLGWICMGVICSSGFGVYVGRLICKHIELRMFHSVCIDNEVFVFFIMFF